MAHSEQQILSDSTKRLQQGDFVSWVNGDGEFRVGMILGVSATGKTLSVRRMYSKEDSMKFSARWIPSHMVTSQQATKIPESVVKMYMS